MYQIQVVKNPILQPTLPVERLVEVLANIIEKTTERKFGYFHPTQPLDSFTVFEILVDFSKWASMAQKGENNWKFHFEVITDIRKDVLRLEITTVKRFFPVKLCFMDASMDLFDRSIIFSSTTPIEFVFSFRNLLQDTKTEIEVWNKLCALHKPILPERLPVSQIMGHLVFEQSAEIGKIYDLFDGVEFVQGDWVFGFNVYCGFGDWMVLQSYLRNQYLKCLVFILHEMDINIYRHYGCDLEEIILEAVAGSEAALVFWNQLVTEGVK